MTEQELLADTLRRLNQAGIAYMLTGSMASNYWGIPRSTHDLDFVVQVPRSSIPVMAEAFKDGFALEEQSNLTDDLERLLRGDVRPKTM